MHRQEPQLGTPYVDPHAAARTDAQWRRVLNALEYQVLRQQGTEAPFTGSLLNERRPGVYCCRGCGAQLFNAATKFDSGCGWPSFYDPSRRAAVVFLADTSTGQMRTEVRCANCGGHLGHVFTDAPQTPTGQRYCMNSVSLRFIPDPQDPAAAAD